MMLEEGSREYFEPEERQHRRGNFPAINVGITHGKGSPVLTNLANQGHQELVERLLADAAFASGAYSQRPGLRT